MHTIRNEWTKGELCQFKDDKNEIFRVMKVYTDFNNNKRILINGIKRELALDLYDDRNLIKINKEINRFKKYEVK